MEHLSLPLLPLLRHNSPPHSISQHRPCLQPANFHPPLVCTPCLLVQHTIPHHLPVPFSTKVMLQVANLLVSLKLPLHSNHNFPLSQGNNQAHQCQPLPLLTQQPSMAAIQPIGSWLSYPRPTKLSQVHKSATHTLETPFSLTHSPQIQSFSLPL